MRLRLTWAILRRVMTYFMVCEFNATCVVKSGFSNGINVSIVYEIIDKLFGLYYIRVMCKYMI